jgi:hypothetical protein
MDLAQQLALLLVLAGSAPLLLRKTKALLKPAPM